MAQGHFIWNELVSNDVEKAKAFYANAMGWTYDRFPMPNGEAYWIIKLGEHRIGGMYAFKHPDGVSIPDFWLPYIDVDDVDASVSKAVTKGARLMKPVFDVPNIGRMAMLAEPGGASVAWMTPTPK
jgi:predicted enzyme related to lactoylglutathione lyase